MIVDSLVSFKKQLSKKPKSILILSKEGKEIEDALKIAIEGKPLRFNRENFDPKLFIAEFESTSFLTQKRQIVVEEAEKVYPESLIQACEKPGDVTLIMAGESISSKIQEKVELVLKFASKKPYEREAELSSFLVEKASSEGVSLSADTARIWVKSFGLDKSLLESELDKLLCYVGYKGEITLQMVRDFSITMPHLTLWQLGDALFARSRREAWQVVHALLEEGGSVYQILSHLRTQFESGIRMLAAHKRGQLAQEFPYLKGSLGQKKVALLSGFGQSRLKRGLSLLFEAELRAKSETVTPEMILEPLMVRLTA